MMAAAATPAEAPVPVSPAMAPAVVPAVAPSAAPLASTFGSLGVVSSRPLFRSVREAVEFEDQCRFVVG